MKTVCTKSTWYNYSRAGIKPTNIEVMNFSRLIPEVSYRVHNHQNLSNHCGHQYKTLSNGLLVFIYIYIYIYI